MKRILIPAGIYLLKVSNRNTRARCEICLKLIIKSPELKLKIKTSGSGVFIINFEHVSQLVLIFLLLNLKM